MKKVLNVFGIFFSVIISIILFSMVLVTIFYNSSKDTISVKMFDKVINNISGEELVSLITRDDEEEFNEFLKDTNLKKEDFINIINDKETRNLIFDILYGYEYYFKTGKLDKFVSEKEFNNYIEISIDRIINTFNIELTPDEIVELKDELRIQKNNIDDFKNNQKKFFDSNSDNIVIGAFKFYYSNLIINIFIFIIVILILLIALFRFSYYKWMIYSSISFMSASLLSLFVINLKPVVMLSNPKDKQLVESCISEVIKLFN